MDEPERQVRPVVEVPWEHVERVFGTRGDPGRCWCQYFKVTNAEWQKLGGAACASRLLAQVQDARDDPTASSPGLVAYLGDEPVGWVAVEPRTAYPVALRGRVIRGGSSYPDDDSSVWAIVCFVVRVGYRRRGIAGTLLAAAVEAARRGGARVVEGYPVDVAEKPKASSASLYHGTLSLFEGAGFQVAARPAAGRALVTLTL